MKRLFVLISMFLFGCSNKIVLNCSYVDSSFLLGNKNTNDVFIFKNNRIISYKKVIIFDINDDTDRKLVSKYVKLDGKSLKKYIGGNYSIKNYDDRISLIFNTKNFDKLNFVDSSYGYDDVLNAYSSLGFMCK